MITGLIKARGLGHNLELRKPRDDDMTNRNVMTSRNSEAKLEPNQDETGWQNSRESEQKTRQISRKIDGSNTSN